MQALATADYRGYNWQRFSEEEEDSYPLYVYRVLSIALMIHDPA
jgi:hypothetical protein